MNLFWVVILPFLGALLIALSRGFGWKRGPALLAFLFTCATIAFAFEPISQIIQDVEPYPYFLLSWAPSLELYLSLQMDGLGMAFCILILGIGLLIVIYANWYLSTQENLGNFFAHLMFFMGSMLGIVLSHNLLLLVLFWELTSVSSFFLIGFWHQKESSRRGAYQALMVTALGGLSLLGGVILLGFIAGTFEWTEILAQKEMILNNPLWPAVLLLILLGCFTKSAQFPFHFWLPDAMQAPTPVSAYLHSATMVKAGIFLLARFFPLFAGTALWFYSVSFVGITTMIIGSYIAFRQNDLKALLAYSTISHLGMIVTLLGFGTEEGAEAALFHVYNHAAFKASLFLGVGIVDHETGTRDLNKLGGIWKCLPQTAFLITVAAMAMAGIPFFNGFLSKELFLEATLSTRFSGTMGFLFPSLAVFASIFTMAYSVRLILKTFLGPSSKDLPKSPHEPFFLMRFPILFLGIVCMAIGIAPHIFIEPLLEPTVVPVIGHFKDLHLQIYHGINSALFMSMVAIAGGAYVYFLRERVFKIQALVSLGIAGNRIYQRVIHYLVLFAKLLTNALQSRSLRNYFAVCLIFSLFAIGMPFFKNFYKLKLLNFEMGPPVFPFYLALIIIAAFAVAVFEKRRLIAIICLGFVGTLVSLFFARMSAPDLALTQLSVEVCMTVAFLLVMYFLPKSGQKEREKEAPESKIRIFHDILLSTACAVGLALLLLITLGEPFDSISSWHLANSFEKAGGNNVVNVILVDFRGFDTMGEITVLGLAALGIMALVRARRQSP